MSSRRTQYKQSKSLLDYTKQKSAEPSTTQRQHVQAVDENSIVAALESMLRVRRVVKRGELESWAKLKGYPLNTVMRGLMKLAGAGKVVKRLSDDGELVYVWKEN